MTTPTQSNSLSNHYILIRKHISTAELAIVGAYSETDPLGTLEEINNLKAQEIAQDKPYAYANDYEYYVINVAKECEVK